METILGVFDLISGSPKLVPLTFHMLRSAIRLCGPDQKFLPLWAPILEVLKFLPTGKNAPKLEKVIEGDTNKNQALPDFQMALRLSSAQNKNKRNEFKNKIQ